MYILAAICLIGSAAAITDLNCTSGGTYTETSVACDNVYSDASCGLVYLNNTAVQPGGADERPAPCFNGTSGPSEDIKAMAIANCPRTCGYCCQTPEFACTNAQFPRINCGTITARMCKDPTWRDIIAQDCPAACGFCLLGGCIDTAPECDKQPTVCVTRGMEDFVARNCQRTCGLCSTTTAASGITNAPGVTSGPSTCTDAPQCASWVRNGFCTNAFYSADVKRQRCGRACGLC